MERSFMIVTADHWTAKNKLQEEIQKLIRSFNRLIFNTNDDKAKFLKMLHSKIYELNKEYNRCKPLIFDKMHSTGAVECWGVRRLIHFDICDENLKQITDEK